MGQTGKDVVTLIMGLGATAGGAFFAFNLRGAADRWVAYRDGNRALAASRTMQLDLTRPSSLGTGFFRLVGGFVLLCGVVVSVITVGLLIVDARAA
jgi:hypothetical protein